MLRAEKVALEQAAYQQLLQIREKELNYFVDNYTSIGTQAALLAGFTISALTELSDMPPGWLTTVFHTTIILALISGLHCVLATTFATVWGPGLALRGPKGSMVRAVNGMVEEQKDIFTSFGVCMGSFAMLGITASWLVMQIEAAIIATMVFLVGSYMCFRHCQRIYRRFLIPKEVPAGNWENRTESTAQRRQISTTTATSGGLHQPSADSVDDNESLASHEKRARWKLFGRNRHAQLEDDVSEVGYNPPPEKEVFMEGYLTKKGLERTISTWNRRYFVLQGQYLSYYKSRDDYMIKQKAIKSRPIDLSGYEVVGEADVSQKNGPLTFSLHPVDEEDERRVWDFQCDTQEEYSQWTKSLRAAIPLTDDI